MISEAEKIALSHEADVLKAILPEAHREDGRRTLYEVIPEGVGAGIQLIVVDDELGAEEREVELGRHYHQGLTELFTLLKGAGRVLLQSRLDAPRVCYDLEAGDTVEVPPGTVHLFGLKAGSVLKCVVSGVTNRYRPGRDAMRAVRFRFADN